MRAGYQAGSIFCIILVTLFLTPRELTLPAVPAFAAGALVSEFQGGVILFGGDAMLGRGVERIMRQTGAGYPFEGVKNIVASADVTVVNFEAAAPAEHTLTQNGNLRLSVSPKAFHQLAEANFNVVSLANNHSYDFGVKGLANTRALCVTYNLICVGDPRGMREASTAVVTVGSTDVGILALHTVVGQPKRVELQSALEQLSAKSDVQVAYIHWGEEYKEAHNKSQETLAHELIELGVDAVVGHHPHVVQDIEIYQGKPIFYSLGNFIFDQYLSEKTETGLLVQMQFSHTSVAYTLVPVSSLETPSQPHLMDVDARNRFVDELVERSDDVAEYMDGAALVVRR